MTVDRLIAIAAGAVGQGEGDPGFRVLCGPGETEQRQRELAGLSTCALFLRGCLAEAYIDARGQDQDMTHGLPPRLWAPYVTERAMGDLIAVCRTRVVPGYAAKTLINPWVVPGALVVVGVDPRLHVYLVERVERDRWPDGSIEVTTIEAGQVDGNGRQRVERKRHEIDASGIDRILREQDHATGDWVPSSVGPCHRPVAYVLEPRSLLEGA